MSRVKDMLERMALGNGMPRINFDQSYQTKAYKDAEAFANQYIGVQGAREVIGVLQQNYTEYDNLRKQLKSEEAQNEIDMYLAWENVCKKRPVPILAAILSFILSLILISHSSNAITAILGILSFLVGIISVVIVIALRIAETIKWRKYIDYTAYVEGKISGLNDEYLRKVKSLRDEIDRLYLESLSPVERELILTRRNMERMNQEMVRLRQENRREQMMLREEQQKTRMEQQKARMVQEELLEIERKREERYNRL